MKAALFQIFMRLSTHLFLRVGKLWHASATYRAHRASATVNNSPTCNTAPFAAQNLRLWVWE